MEILTKKPLEVRKKISMNMNIEILKLVKELSKLTKTNDTIIIEALLVKGVDPLIKQTRNTWLAMSAISKDEEEKKKLKDLLKRLEEISKKKEYKPLLEA